MIGVLIAWLFRSNCSCLQILAVTWGEFETALEAVSELEALRRAHTSYLKKILFRFVVAYFLCRCAAVVVCCTSFMLYHSALLNTKAAPVMRVITEIFSVVLRFHSQVCAWY